MRASPTFAAWIAGTCLLFGPGLGAKVGDNCVVDSDCGTGTGMICSCPSISSFAKTSSVAGSIAKLAPLAMCLQHEADCGLWATGWLGLQLATSAYGADSQCKCALSTATAQIKGGLVMTVPDADAFLTDTVAQDAVKAGIASAHSTSSITIAPSNVQLTVEKARRILGVQERRLAGSVKVGYTITVQAASLAAVTQTAKMVTVAALTTAIETKVKAEKGANFAIEVSTKETPGVLATTAAPKAITVAPEATTTVGKTTTTTTPKATTVAATTAFKATIPIVFHIVTMTDGTGTITDTLINKRVAELNKYFKGQDPFVSEQVNVTATNLMASTIDSCAEKCDVAMCYESGAHQSKIDVSDCYCDPEYCTLWSRFGRPLKLLGPTIDSEISFTVKKISYVANDEWYGKCCCQHKGGISYKPQQVPMFDALVDKSTVRSVMNIMTCDMQTTGGQSSITGAKGGCGGGPGIMLSVPEFKLSMSLLAHETGHYLGLGHTFAATCPQEEGSFCNNSNVAQVCDPAQNVGDGVTDTPLQMTKGTCKTGKDSCPNQAGDDPIDNIMSYSGCGHLRFTAGQVSKMQQTIKTYYPAFTTAGGTPTDLPCSPCFPNGVVPAGYAPPEDAYCHGRRLKASSRAHESLQTEVDEAHAYHGVAIDAAQLLVAGCWRPGYILVTGLLITWLVVLV